MRQARHGTVSLIVAGCLHGLGSSCSLTTIFRCPSFGLAVSPSCGFFAHAEIDFVTGNDAFFRASLKSIIPQRVVRLDMNDRSTVVVLFLFLYTPPYALSSRFHISPSRVSVSPSCMRPKILKKTGLISVGICCKGSVILRPSQNGDVSQSRRCLEHAASNYPLTALNRYDSRAGAPFFLPAKRPF